MHKLIIAILAVACLSIVASPSHAQQAPLKVAVVNIEAVLGVAKAPKSIRQQVKSIREQLRAQVQKQESDLRKANQDLAQKQTLMDSAAFKEERRKFEQKVLNVQKSVQQKNMSLQKAHNEAQNKVKEALRKIVFDIANQRGYTLVLRRAQTLVVLGEYDITKDVIAALDKHMPTIKVSTGS